jgi:uncharacterized Zn finger protein (UPF0148 family)
VAKAEATVVPIAAAVNGKKVMPDTCPSCGKPSFGNWVRLDGHFGCGACGAAY